MPIEIGSKYQISDTIKSYYNSADTLTIIRQNGVTAQFTLGDGKGYGSMPIQHLNYLVKRTELTLVKSKRSLINPDVADENIG